MRPRAKINVSGCLESSKAACVAKRSCEAKVHSPNQSKKYSHETRPKNHRTPTHHHTRPRARPSYPPRHLIQQRQRQYPMRRLFAIQQRHRLRNLPTPRQHSTAHRPPRSLRQRRRLGLPLCLRRPWRSTRLLRQRQTHHAQLNPAGKRRNPAQKKLAMHQPAARHHLPKRR